MIFGIMVMMRNSKVVMLDTKVIEVTMVLEVSRVVENIKVVDVTMAMDNTEVVEVTMVMDNTKVVDVTIVEDDTMVNVSRDQKASDLLVNKILLPDKSNSGVV